MKDLILTYYKPHDETLQPTCTAISENGELQWTFIKKQPWHLKMFPSSYDGDLSSQWMMLCAYEKGMSYRD